MSIFNISDIPAPAKASEDVITDTAANVVDNKDVTLSDDKAHTDGNKTIVLDGPLSAIYTKALNMVYSKEDIISMIKTDNDPTDPSDSDIYMYCCSDKDIDNGGLVEASNKLRLALDNKKTKKVVLAFESNGTVSSKYGLLSEFASGLGIECYHSRSAAMNSIKNITKVK